MNWIFSLLKFIGIENISDLKAVFRRPVRSEPAELRDLNQIERCLLFLAYPDQGIICRKKKDLLLAFVVLDRSHYGEQIPIILRAGSSPSITFGKIKTVETELPRAFVDRLRELKDIHFSCYRGRFKLNKPAKTIVRNNYTSMLDSTVDFFKDNFDFDLAPYYLPRAEGD